MEKRSNMAKQCSMYYPLFCLLSIFQSSHQQSGISLGLGSGSGRDLITTTQPSTEGPLLTDGQDFLSFLNIEEIDNGDLSELGHTLDGCSSPVYMNEGIPYGSRTETILRVCSNGVISFGRPFTWWYPNVFPSRYFGVRESNVVAVFWNDHDNRLSGSRIIYKTYNPNQGTAASAKLELVSHFVSRKTKSDFSGIWMLVAHWIDVPPYPFGSYYYQRYYGVSAMRNSYQAIIVTDGFKTYTVFNYNCDMIEWSGSYRYSVVGYNINSKSARSIDFPSYTNHPLSGYREINMVACNNTEYGVSWSNLVYQIGAATDLTQRARAECLSRATKDIRSFRGKQQSYDRPCPCSFWQAIFDSRYRYASYYLAQITGDSSFYNSLCYVQRFKPSSPNIGVQLCCYSYDFSNFGALLDSSFGYYGSSLLRYNPFWDQASYLKNDYPFREYCCFDGDICKSYTSLRPADSCSTYVAPRRAWCWGDPHITNLDGGVFTFNGWGEYTLLDINTANTSFVLQGRTHPVGNSTATQLVAIAFGLSKYSPVEVRLPGENDTEPLLVFFEGRDILANVSNTNDTFEHINATITRSSPTSLVASFPNGIGMIVNASAMLGFTLIVPEEFRSMGSGLSGNFNGDATDDVAFKNGTILTPPVDDRILHEVGQSWIIEQEDSLFTYPEGSTAAEYQVPDHMPVFLTEVLAAAPQDVLDACGDNDDCIFDAIQTGDINIGIQTMSSNQQNLVEQEQGANTPPVILGPRILQIRFDETAELHFNVTDNNISTINVYVAGGVPENATLTPFPGNDYIDYVFKWLITEETSAHLVFVAEDEMEARSVLNVQVQICACLYGNCTTNGVIGLSANIVMLNCECPEGREGLFCEEDINGCAQTTCFEGVECVDIPAPGVGAECGPCPNGYFGDGGKCADIDECINGTENCADICVNTEGGFQCDCNPGYRLLNATHCKDVDECSIRNGGCHQICTNNNGGYNCSCTDGYELSSDRTSCTVSPDSMCIDPNNCDQVCVRLSGVEQCSCMPGYELRANGETCENVNECKESPCDHDNGVCTDNLGSFSCSCGKGFTENGIQCQDMNECVEAALGGSDLCETDTTMRYCINTVGGYMCICPDGVEQRGDTCVNLDLEPKAPPGYEEYIIAIKLDEYSLFRFTVTIEDAFRTLTAQAINKYCESNVCIFSKNDRAKRQVELVTEDAVFITDIATNDDGQVTFYVYVETENGILSGITLLNAINNFRNEYADGGFSLSANLLVHVPTVPPSITIPTLSAEQRVIIAVVVSIFVAIIGVAVVIVIVWCFVISKKKKSVVLVEEEELRKFPLKSNKIQPDTSTSF